MTSSLSTQSFLKAAPVNSGAWRMRTATSCQNGTSAIGAANRAVGRSQSRREPNLGSTEFIADEYIGGRAGWQGFDHGGNQLQTARLCAEPWWDAGRSLLASCILTL